MMKEKHEKIESDGLNEQLRYRDMLRKIGLAKKNKKKVELTSEFFTKPFIEWLLDEGAFQGNRFNRYDPSSDADFLKKMLRRKGDWYPEQQRKIRAIILNSVIPFAEKMMSHRISSIPAGLSVEALKINNGTSKEDGDE